MIKYLLISVLVLVGGIALAQTEEQKPEEVKIDTEIKAEDLGVKEAKVLPGSFFYGFKNFVRGIREAVALDPVKKAELQLQYANEKIIEVQQLVEKDDSQKAAEIAAGVIRGINKNFEKIVQQGENLKKAKNQDKVEKFLDKIADQSLKQQVVLQKLGEQVPENAFAKIEEARQEHLTRFGEVMTKVASNPQEFAQRLPQIIENRQGSDFKELKAVEILRDLEDKVSDDAKENLRTAQAVISQKFEQRFASMPEETRTEKFQNYVEFMSGNAVRQFEAFDVMRQNFQSPEMVQEMEIAKDKAIQKFENQLGKFQSEEARQSFMAPWTNGDPQSLRTMTEIDMRTESTGAFQPFQQFQEQAQNNFKERFGDNPEQLRQNPVFQKMESRPDIVDLKMSQDMVKIFSPSEKEPIQGMPAEGTPSALNFMKDFQNQAAGKFIENVSNQPAGQEGKMFGPPVPGGLKVLEGIKNQVPFQGQQGINRAIEAQTQRIEQQNQKMEEIINQPQGQLKPEMRQGQQPILKPQPIQRQQPIPQNQPSIQNVPLSQPSAGGTQNPPPMPTVQPAP